MNHQEIAQCLAGSLQSDPNVRMAAELRLSELFSHPETSIALTELVISQDIDVAIRQISVALRKYILERWSPFFSQFRGAAPPAELKERVRDLLFSGLTDPQRKIRTTCAFAVSTISHSDWPDQYPNLLTGLITLLSSDYPDAVHGAMQVFTEFVRSDLTEDQLLPVLQQLLPILMAILGSEKHSALTRARSVLVFRQCVESLSMVKEQHPQATLEASDKVIPTWLDAFCVLLETDPTRDLADPNGWDFLAIRIQIFKTLAAVLNLFPRAQKQHIPRLLHLSIQTLNVLLPSFRAYHVVASATPPATESADDSDQAASLPKLGSAVLDFLGAISRTPKGTAIFEASENGNGLEAVIRCVIGWTQMTEEDAENWMLDPNAFVADEDDETEVWSLRAAGFDLISSLLEKPAPVTRALQTVIQSIVQESSQARSAGQQDWWRPLEASLAVLCSDTDALVTYLEKEESEGRPIPFDLESLLSGVVPSVLSIQESPFLQGRGFVFASKFTTFCPGPLSEQYMNAAMDVLESADVAVPVKVSAIKAIRNFCSQISDKWLHPFASRITLSLGPIIGAASEDTLTLVLETLDVVLRIERGSWLTAELASSLTSALLNVWVKNAKDPMLFSVLTDVFTSIASASSPGVYQILASQSLPNIVQAINHAPTTEAWLAGSGIELITSVIQGAPDGGLGDGFFAAFAPSLFQCIATTEDREIMVKSTECLTYVVRKGSDQLLAWSDDQGRSGLDLTLAFVARMLSPQENESGGLFIGDLMIHLFRKAGDSVLPVLPDLLRALVTRITTAKSATFTQSLIIPFAYLINLQRDTVLAMLASITVSDPPKNGLEVLVSAWCENAETFQGFWANRISNLALCQMFLSNNPALRQMTVKGDLIVKPESENVIMTRSRAKKIPHEYTWIPFPVKALKIVLHELRSSATVESVDPTTAGDEESDDDEGWLDEEKVFMGMKKEELGFLSDFIDDDAVSDFDDEDMKDDPITQIDFKAHLVQLLKDCAAQNPDELTRIIDQLNVEETILVKHALSQ